MDIWIFKHTTVKCTTADHNSLSWIISKHNCLATVAVYEIKLASTTETICLIFSLIFHLYRLFFFQPSIIPFPSTFLFFILIFPFNIFPINYLYQFKYNINYLVNFLFLNLKGNKSNTCFYFSLLIYKTAVTC